MITCYVLGCGTTVTNKPDNVDFYRITPNIKDTWCEAIGRDPVQCEGEHICSQHFKDTDFTTGRAKRRILKAGAVPSIRLEYIKTIDNKYIPIQKIDRTFRNILPKTSPPPLKKFKLAKTKAENVPKLVNIPKLVTERKLVTVPKPVVRQKEENLDNFPKPVINRREEKLDLSKQIEEKFDTKPALKLLDDVKIVKVDKVDKTYERRKGIIQIFNAEEVASDIESSETESSPSELSESEDSDCEITSDYLIQKNTVTGCLENAATNATSILQNMLTENVNSANTIGKNPDSIETPPSANMVKKDQIVLSISNSYGTFTSSKTKEKFKVLCHNPNEITKVDKIAKFPGSENLINIIQKHLDKEEQYILIKPEAVHNITTEKIEKCIAVLTGDAEEDKNNSQKNQELCSKCKSVLVKSIDHDHFYSTNSGPEASEKHKRLQGTVVKQTKFIKETKRNIKRLYDEIAELEETITKQNEILDTL